MKNKNVEVIEANLFVKKYQGDIFQKRFVDYRGILDRQTLEEHERQISRLNEGSGSL